MSEHDYAKIKVKNTMFPWSRYDVVPWKSANVSYEKTVSPLQVDQNS